MPQKRIGTWIDISVLVISEILIAVDKYDREIDRFRAIKASPHEKVEVTQRFIDIMSSAITSFELELELRCDRLKRKNKKPDRKSAKRKGTKNDEPA